MRENPRPPLRDEHRVDREEQETDDRMRDEEARIRDPVDGPARARSALERAKEEERGDETRGDEQRVGPRLLGPLDEEGAGREEEPAHQRDPAIEELPGQDHQQRARQHRADDRREPHRPLRRSDDARPGLLDPVVERLIPLELLDVRAVDLPERVRLVVPERRRPEPDQPENEGDAAHDGDIQRQRARAHAVDQRAAGSPACVTRVRAHAHASPMRRFMSEILQSIAIGKCSESLVIGKSRHWSRAFPTGLRPVDQAARLSEPAVMTTRSDL